MWEMLRGSRQRVATIDAGQGDSGEDGHVGTMILEQIEIRGAFVIEAGGLREKEIRQDAHVCHHADKAAGLFRCCGMKSRHHAFQERKGERGSRRL